MKPWYCLAAGLCLPLVGLAAPQSLDELVDQVRRDRALERAHHKQREARFTEDRDRQRASLDAALAEKAAEEERANVLRETYEANESRILALRDQLRERSGDMESVFAVARQAALDTRNALEGSLVSAQIADRAEFLKRLGTGHELPTIGDLEQLWILSVEEMNEAGKITRFEAPVITANGEESLRTVTRIGVFTATADGAFLRYLPKTKRLVELSRQPPLRQRRAALALERASEGLHPVPVDPSRGAILGLLVRSPTPLERIHEGGGVGYLILALGALGLLIIVYRSVVIEWIGRRVRRQVGDQHPRDNNPLGRLRTLWRDGLGDSPTVLATRLEDALVEHAEGLRRGLPTLTLLAAITPLLGLLGTVTGMIETFQSITLFGTGDPKVMSGGISQALVTTQLGLAVAIPVLLLHGFLNARANGVIEVLEHETASLLATQRR